MKQNRNILLIALATGLLLLIPLAAMQFTGEVNWKPLDFAAAGVLLFGTGLALELATRKAPGLVYKAALAAALGTALFLVWANLAVGIVGDEDNPINWIYLGVIAVGVVGAIVARLRAGGMARALFATAFAQALAAAIALAAVQDVPVTEVLLVNGFFAALWVGSSLLFWRAEAVQNRRAE